MAELESFFDDEWVAHLKPVQAELFVRTREMASDAAILLAQHRAEGHSFIEIEHGRIDYHIILNDTNGLEAAKAIEYGRKVLDEDGNVVEGQRVGGIRVLHRATGLRGY